MKKAISILLSVVLLLSLLTTAAYADTNPSKITPELAERIAAAAPDEKLPVTVSADLSISDEERAACEREAADQAEVPYGGEADFNAVDPAGFTMQEERDAWSAETKKWAEYRTCKHELLRAVRIEKIDSILDASGTAPSDRDGGEYTTGCLMLPKKLMLTPAQIDAVAGHALVTSIGVNDDPEYVREPVDLSRFLPADLLERLEAMDEDDRVTVSISYQMYRAPYRQCPDDDLTLQMYGINEEAARTDLQRLWKTYLNGRNAIRSDYYRLYLETLRLKKLDLSAEDIVVYRNSGLPDISLLKLTKSHLNQIIQNDDLESVSLVDPYGDPPAPEQPEEGYYMVGTMTDWELDPHYRLSENYNHDGTYLIWKYLEPNDRFKIVYSADGVNFTKVFPEGRGNAFNQESPIITKKGYYTFLFRPACDGGISYYYGDAYYFDEYGNRIDLPQTWYYNCIFCAGYRPVTGEPQPDTTPTTAGYYVVGSMNDWQLNNRYKMRDVSDSGRVFDCWNLRLLMNDTFKIAYSADGESITKLYPEGEGNAYNEDVFRIRADGPSYCITFYPYGDAPVSAHYGMIDAYGAEEPEDDLTPLPIPAKGELFKNTFIEKYRLENEDPESWSYRELYYHKDQNHETDWVLLRAQFETEQPADFAAVIGNRVFTQYNRHTPFTVTYGVYDVKNDRFVDIANPYVFNAADYPGILRAVDEYACAEENGSGRLLGDLDGDDSVTVVDVTILQRCEAKIRAYPDNDVISGDFAGYLSPLTCYSDFNRDGERDIMDATCIQRYLVGLSYPRSLSLSAQIFTNDSHVIAKASSAIGTEPIQYCYTIDGSFHGHSEYGSDFGRFSYDDPDYEPEPGSFHITTGYIADNEVELPVQSLTSNDSFTLTVKAKDASGTVSQPVILHFQNNF